MKEYSSILGWKQSTLDLPCIAFDKKDGSQIRAVYRKRGGFCKYGSRHQLIDKNHPFLGEAIPLFENTLAEKLDNLFRTNRKMPGFDEATVFMEFYGPSSCFGQHIKEESKTLTIFDVNLTKRGLILPRDFIKWFADFPIPQVLYEGNFNISFIEDVRNGKYGNGEGVVAKGIRPNAKKEQHNIWMAKVKTNAWMEKLKEFAATNTNLQKLYEDNVKEQLFS